MPRNVFHCAGGEELTTLGAAWFVSYCYYDHVDDNCINWNLVSTAENRRDVYNRTENYHRAWLEEVMDMQDENLNKNKIGLTAEEVKTMADKLLQTM